MARPLYRSRQVWHALRPSIDDDELALACALLSGAQARIFFSMQRRDQRHALEVFRRLRMSGAVDCHLLTAALLHDCGKGAVPVWLRILQVLRPGLVSSIGHEGSAGPRGAAYRLAHHASLGGRRALEAGCSPTTVRLIEGRPEAHEAALASLLLSADDAS